MNVKRFILSSLLVFVWVFITDFLVHGVLLKGVYEQTPHLWRTEEEYGSLAHIMMLSQILFSLIFGFIFTRNYESKGVAEGLRFGAYIGLLFAVIEISKYSYMPVDWVLPLSWAGYTFVQATIAGVLLSLIYKK